MIEQLYKSLPGIQIGLDQAKMIEQSIKQYTCCRLLVFGVGNDSLLWHKINSGGKTVFLENVPEWLSKIHKKWPELKIHRVNYATKRKDWKKLLNSPRRLTMSLPLSVTSTKWDVIIVDSPCGYSPETPGRMKSIYMASRLSHPKSVVWVDDTNRQVEQVYSEKYLKPKFTSAKIIHSETREKHSHMTRFSST